MPLPGQSPEHGLDLGVRAAVERPNTVFPSSVSASSRRRRSSGAPGGYQAASPKAAQNPAQVSGVESKLSADLRGGGRLTVGELVEDADLGERVRTLEQTGPEDADLLGIESVEATDVADVAGESGGGARRDPEETVAKVN